MFHVVVAGSLAFAAEHFAKYRFIVITSSAVLLMNNLLLSMYLLCNNSIREADSELE